MKKLSGNIPYIVLIIILSIFSILPFFKQGFFSMHDDTQVARIAQMAQSLSDGMFPVRWAKDLGYGFGYPIFNFYSPFPFYFGALFALVVSNALLATKITFIFAIVFAGIAMYFFVKEFFTKIAALVSAVVYVYMPYHAVNIYVRGNLNEVFAYAFLPLVFLGFFKLYGLGDKQSKFSWIVILAASIALIIISHNLSALMLAFILAVICVPTLLWVRNKHMFLISIFASSVLALGLSAFYWLPVIFEMKFTNVMSQVGGTADFRDHFICPFQLWNSIWGFGGSEPGCLDGMSFKLGKANIVFATLALVGFIGLFMKKKIKDHLFLQGALFLLVVFSAFMTVSYSSFLWESNPILKFLQFPWRFLNFTALGLSVAVGLLVYYTSELLSNYVAIIAALLIINITIGAQSKLFVPQTYYTNQDNSYYIKWENIAYKASSLTDEYMPPNFNKPQTQEELPTKPVELEQGNAKLTVKSYKAGYTRVEVEAKEESMVKFNTAYFPAWKMFLDGHEVRISSIRDGMIVKVPAGKYLLEAKFVQTPVQKTGNTFSLLTFLVIGGVLIYKRKK